MGSERSPHPYGSNPAVGARESALVRGRGKLGVPAVRPKPASSASRAAAHNRPWGAKGRRAGGRGDALGNLETHRRRSRCTLHVPSERRPLAACQELPHTATATPHLQAVVAVPPLPRVPARAPAARRLTIADQCLLLLGLGSELGVGFWAGGRAVNLGRKRLLSNEKIETCRALSKRGRRTTRYLSRDDVSCARSAEAGIIPGRYCGESRLLSSRASFSGGLASMWCASRRHGSARCITDCANKPGRRCATSHIECTMHRAAGVCANVICKSRARTCPEARRATPPPESGLTRTVR